MNAMEKFMAFVPDKLCRELLEKKQRAIAAEYKKLSFYERILSRFLLYWGAIIIMCVFMPEFFSSLSAKPPTTGESVVLVKNHLVGEFLEILEVTRSIIPKDELVRLNGEFVPIASPREYGINTDSWLSQIEECLDPFLSTGSIHELYSAFVARVAAEVDKSPDGLELFADITIRKDGDGYYLDYTR